MMHRRGQSLSLTRLSKKADFGIFIKKQLLKTKELSVLILSVFGFFDSLNEGM
jgi:hypothetical protein